MGTRKDPKKDWVGYYDQENILNEITEEPVAFSLNETLLQDIPLDIGAGGRHHEVEQGMEPGLVGLAFYPKRPSKHTAGKL